VALAALFYVYPKDLDEMLTAIEEYSTDKTGSPIFRLKELWPDLAMALMAHQKAFGRTPSTEDIRFFKSMTQDIHIHRPNES
jgi:hypothetical protein